MTRRPHLAATLAPLVLSGLVACGSEATPTPSTGERLFRQHLCASCHGGAGEGTWMGPPLKELAQHWQRESLAAFLLDPRPFVAEDERLAELMRKYPNPMVGNHTLGSEERLQLADWLLTR